MKLIFLTLAACSIAVLAPEAGSSQDTVQSPLHVIVPYDRAHVSLTADNIVREDPPVHGSTSPYASITRLTGHVEIRTCCIQPSPSNRVATPAKDPPRAYLVIHADAADYHEDSGEIEAHGTVRVNFQPRK